jgi:hypothetical protein
VGKPVFLTQARGAATACNPVEILERDVVGRHPSGGAATACNPICRGALATFGLVTLRVMRRDRGREHMTPEARKERKPAPGDDVKAKRLEAVASRVLPRRSVLAERR